MIIPMPQWMNLIKDDIIRLAEIERQRVKEDTMFKIEMRLRFLDESDNPISHELVRGLVVIDEDFKCAPDDYMQQPSIYKKIKVFLSVIDNTITKQLKEMGKEYLGVRISDHKAVMYDQKDWTPGIGAKSLHNTDVNGARKNVKDIVVFGNGDMFQLLCKASSENEGWMKSTKAMEIPGAGCVVQVTTQQRNPDGSYSLDDAVTFVPQVQIKETRNADGVVVGRELVSTPLCFGEHPVMPNRMTQED